jgi:hypothetical protein
MVSLPLSDAQLFSTFFFTDFPTDSENCFLIPQKPNNQQDPY